MLQLHVYNISSSKWSDLSSPVRGTPPWTRVGMGFAGWNDKLYVFGGRILSGIVAAPRFNDILPTPDICQTLSSLLYISGIGLRR